MNTPHPYQNTLDGARNTHRATANALRVVLERYISGTPLAEHLHPDHLKALRIIREHQDSPDALRDANNLWFKGLDSVVEAEEIAFYQSGKLLSVAFDRAVALGVMP